MMKIAITHIPDNGSMHAKETVNVNALENAIWKIVRQTASSIACSVLIRLPLNESLTRSYKPTLENRLIQYFNRQEKFKFSIDSLLVVDRGNGRTYCGTLYTVKRYENGKYVLMNIHAKPPYDREEIYDKYWVEKHFQYM
ncbi:MAG: hypothetical protein WCT36_05490 [Candidatus Gracilibacteria bacterium]|jgi:hypothetical protein